MPTRRRHAPRGNISIRRFDKRREGDLVVAFVGRPHADLLAVLPLNGNHCDQPGSVFHRVGELVVAAVELDAAHGSEVVGRFERGHELIQISRTASALDRFSYDMDHVIGRVADIGRRDAVLLDVGLSERNGGGRQSDIRRGCRGGDDSSAAPLVSFQKALVVAWELCPIIGIGTC